MVVSHGRFRMVAHLACAAAAVLIVLAGVEPALAGDTTERSFFATREIRLTDLRRFEKWQTALERYAAERATAEGRPCTEPASLACRYREWQTFLDGLRGQSRRQQLIAVNRFMNARPYRSDKDTWGASDHWSTPGEFLTRSGDCEDYAIAKFLSLKELGWSDDALRLVAVKDQKLGIGHAVVVAYLGGRTWLLDNQIKDVTATDRVSHYRPVYSINESAWWLHRPDGRA